MCAARTTLRLQPPHHKLLCENNCSKHNILLKQRTLAPDMAVTMYVSSPTRVGSSRSVVCRNQRYQAPFPPSAPLRYHTTSAEYILPEDDHT